MPFRVGCNAVLEPMVRAHAVQSFEAARFHHPARQRFGLAVRGARAAAGRENLSPSSRAKLMNRKIAAIMAADIAGYSKLVAEDEEETVRRLSSYRAVFDDFVARASGRVFNTAGDAILAEFPSAVEAVRCAIDVQESLRTRNLAYPPSRQMHFRIGITIGDVVEREEDLLGDGVNIAARLEGLAAPGGICISRSIYEQVANKLSVAFVDIGEQQVKNIPSPIHAYTLALGSTDASTEKTRAKKQPARRGWGLMIAAAAVITFALAGRYTLYFLKTQPLVRTLTGHGAEAD